MNETVGAATASPSLTEIQISALVELEDGGPRYYSNHWKPIKRLLALGYVTYRDIGYSGQYEITDSGRAAIAKAEGRSSNHSTNR